MNHPVCKNHQYTHIKHRELLIAFYCSFHGFQCWKECSRTITWNSSSHKCFKHVFEITFFCNAAWVDRFRAAIEFVSMVFDFSSKLGPPKWMISGRSRNKIKLILDNSTLEIFVCSSFGFVLVDEFLSFFQKTLVSDVSQDTFYPVSSSVFVGKRSKLSKIRTSFF